MPTKKTTTTINLPALKLDQMEIMIIGDTPLLVHAWSEKAKKEMLDKQTKAPTGGKEAKDPSKDFAQSLYKMDDGSYGFPSVAIKSAAVTACTSVGSVTKVAARQAFHVVGEQALIDGVWEGSKVRKDLVRLVAGEPEMSEEMVRIGMGTADLRYRAAFWPWALIVTVRYNAGLLSAAQIVNLMNTAGFGVGIGEWRSEKDGQHGLFHVADEKERREFIKAVA